ncbi:MAG: hypothetical protein LBK61_11810 [Spirochaetaceae bacterium]|nr:hypothetical protein [Spirochaetaceae bacterium]
MREGLPDCGDWGEEGGVIRNPQFPSTSVTEAAGVLMFYAISLCSMAHNGNDIGKQ